jgi:hypothetical protein
MKVTIPVLSILMIFLLTGCNTVSYTPLPSATNTVTLNESGIEIIGLTEYEDLYIVEILASNHSDNPLTLNIRDFQLTDTQQFHKQALTPNAVILKYKEKVVRANDLGAYYADKNGKLYAEAVNNSMTATYNEINNQTTDSTILAGYNSGLATKYSQDLAFFAEHSFVNIVLPSDATANKILFFQKNPTDQIPITIYYKEYGFSFTKEQKKYCLF